MESDHTEQQHAYNRATSREVWCWFSKACSLIKKQPLRLLLWPFLFFTVQTVIWLTTAVGQFIIIALFPVILIGFYMMIDDLRDNKPVLFLSIIEQLKHSFIRLIFSGLLCYFSTVIIAIFFFVFFVALSLESIPAVANPFDTEMANADKIQFILENMTTSLGSWLFIVIGLLILTLLYMAFYFSLYLIHYKKLSIINSYRLSLRTFLSNFLPMGLFITMTAFFFILALLPLGFGLILFFPVMLISHYFCFHAIFAEIQPANEHE